MDLLTHIYYIGFSDEEVNKVFSLIRRDRSGTYDFLGQGFHGCAFDIGEGKIFKITSDRNDALGSLALLQESNPHIMRVYSVFQINDSNYGIVAEKLEPMSKEEHQSWNTIRVLDTAYGYGEDVTSPLQEYGVSDQWLDAIRTILQTQPRTESVQRARLGKDKRDTLEAWNSVFKKHRIVWNDIQGENIMKKDGKYVLSDFGGMGERPNLPIPRIGSKVNGLFLKAVKELTLEGEAQQALGLCEMIQQFRD